MITVIILFAFILLIAIITVRMDKSINVIKEDKQKAQNKANKAVIVTEKHYTLFNFIPFLHFKRIFDKKNNKEYFKIEVFKYLIIKFKVNLC